MTDNGSLTFNLSGLSSFNGTISGCGSLIKIGGGKCLLGGSNSFSGGTTISQGVFQLANPAALLNTTVAINADNGLQFSPGIGTFTLGGLSGNNLLQLVDTTSGTVALIVGGDGVSTTFSGAIGGDGSLIKGGGGGLVLAGSAGHSGGTSVMAGTLAVGSGGTTGSLAGNVSIANNAALVFNRSNVATFSGVISGNGNLVQAGAGVLR